MTESDRIEYIRKDMEKIDELRRHDNELLRSSLDILKEMVIGLSANFKNMNDNFIILNEILINNKKETKEAIDKFEIRIERIQYAVIVSLAIFLLNFAGLSPQEAVKIVKEFALNTNVHVSETSEASAMEEGGSEGWNYGSNEQHFPFATPKKGQVTK